VHSGPEIEIEIEKAELFRVLPEADLRKVRARLHEHSYEPHHVLYFEGNTADRLWIVRSGQIRLYKSSVDGQLTTLDVLGPGEVFGVVSALEKDIYPSSAEAVSKSHVWWLPRERFFKLLSEEPRIGHEILQILSRRLREAHDRLRAFAHDPAPARLAGALLRAANDGEAQVTRRALAEAAGTTVETAIRVLRRFEREGLVEGRVGRVRIVDEPALRELAHR
jgi:CRP/FNR family transcriptional regulator